jgi:tRNA wybutosine-synthesizing protein 3
MSTNFQVKKRKILEQIEVPVEQYTDLSPKGSIDVGIRDLIFEINKIDGLVTTSSCAGRISVFLEGQKKASPVEGPAELSENPDSTLPRPTAGPGGKGGGKWLFVSHEPVPQSLPSSTTSSFHMLFGMAENTPADSILEPGARFIHFKFEAMVRRQYPTT